MANALGIGPAGGCATAERLRAACAWAAIEVDNGRQAAASGWEDRTVLADTPALTPNWCRVFVCAEAGRWRVLTLPLRDFDRLATGDRKLETGDWKQTADSGRRTPESGQRLSQVYNGSTPPVPSGAGRETVLVRVRFLLIMGTSPFSAYLRTDPHASSPKD